MWLSPTRPGFNSRRGNILFCCPTPPRNHAHSPTQKPTTPTYCLETRHPYLTTGRMTRTSLRSSLTTHTKKKKRKVLPRLELGSSGSEPEVLTNYTIEPPPAPGTRTSTYVGFSNKEANKKKARTVPASKTKKRTCRDRGSNTGPLDLQSNALPTELSQQVMTQVVWSPPQIPTRPAQRGALAWLFFGLVVFWHHSGAFKSLACLQLR